MKAASKLASMGSWILAGLIVLASAPSIASEAGGPCDPSGKQPTKLSAKECDVFRTMPASDRSVIYQDSTQTVLVQKSSVSWNGSVVEALVIFDRYRAAPSSNASSTPRSESRRQRIDCARKQQAILERTSYEKAIARGAPIAVQRDVAAGMKPIDPASVEARVAAILCAVAKEG